MRKESGKVLCLLGLAVFTGGTMAPSVRADEPVEALAIYFPGWAPTPAFEAEYGKGWDEWQLVATPRKILPNQKLPLKLQTGVLKGTDPMDCAKEIDLAADAGIDAFLFCWYWYGRTGERPFDESLECGFLNAPNRNRIEFALMWCFHPIGARPFRPPLEGGSGKMRFEPEGSPEEFLAAIDYCIAHYFKEPNYWRRDGGLYFSIYNVGDFLKRIGGREKAKAVLAAADARVRAAGLPGLYFNGINASPSQADDLKDAGFRTLSHYSPPNFYGRIVKEAAEIPYDDVAAALKETCVKFDGAALPYVPSVPTGWDSSMRCASDEPWPWRKSCRYPYYGIVTGNTPDKFKDLLAWAKRRVALDPKKPGVVQICAWNEYTEGCYLVPDNHDGTGMLDAIKEIFGPHSRCQSR